MKTRETKYWIAVASKDHVTAGVVGGFMQAIVATETTRPVFMADVVRIDLPTGLHLGEEVVRIDLLHSAGRLADARVIRIKLGQTRGDALQGLRLVGIGLRQRVEGVGFNEG